MESNEEENILEPEEEALPYHCKICKDEIDSSTAEDNDGFCDVCIENIIK